MCRVCAARAAKSSTKALRATQIKALKEFQSTPRSKSTLDGETSGCLKSVDYYKSIDTSGWSDFDKSLVVSQIKNYDKKCNLYHDKIQDLLSHYSQALPGSTQSVEEHS